jgi:cytochrome d ubiquinol oxidase subunit II
MMIDLTVVWAFIIAFAVAAYVVMDGFDLGIGILFWKFEVGRARDMAMNSVAPVWDGNETWLVFGGGGLLAAFPLAYAIVLPAVYAPLIAMLLGLVFRGVAFEFRGRDETQRQRWDLAFSVGSFVAALSQGIILGALLQGIHVEGRAYAGGWWDWLTPFSLLTGMSLVVGYALLGACWLIWKTDGALQDHARHLAKPLAISLVVAIAAVSAATPFLEGRYYERWFSWPGVLASAQMPVLVAITGFALARAINGRRHWMPFLITLVLFALSMVGLAISVWPDVIPARVSIWQAAAPERSQVFMLIGAAALVPIILGYTIWAYWVFRGKVDEAEYY